MATPGDGEGRIEIVYVLGRGRSGSTIFAQVLGALEGCFYAGEVRALWDPVLTHDSACACGEPVGRCPVWVPVLARLDHVDRDKVVRWQREVVREARTTRQLRGGGAGRAGAAGLAGSLLASGGDWPALRGYREAMREVYAAIVAVTGCATIVDSSKRPSYALVVRSMAGVDPYFLHLVRDPRASAYSWRTRRHTGAAGTTVAQRGALDATLRWDLLNLGAEAVLRTSPPRRRRQLRYEDFAAAPREMVAAVAAWLGRPAETLPFVDERTVRVPTSHALAGNPSRELTGTVTIREDAQWWSAQRPADRWLATAAALPLMWRYRYPLRPR